LAENRDSFWRRHRWLKWFAGGVLVLAVALAVAVSVVLRRTEPFLRAHVVEALEQRFHARVELDSFHVSVSHGLQAEGRGLRIWPPAQVHGVTVAPDGSEPLIRLDEFNFHAPLRFEPGKPISIGVVELKGLDIHVPPKSHFGHMPGESSTSSPSHKALMITFALDRIDCTSAHFVLETNKPGKLPLDFAIARFRLSEVTGGHIRAGSVMHFEAELTNPRPVGIVHSTGSFGPWHDEDPGETPIQGEYQLPILATPCRCIPISTPKSTPPTEIPGWSLLTLCWAVPASPLRGRWCESLCPTQLRGCSPAKAMTLPSTSTSIRRASRTFFISPAATLDRFSPVRSP